MARGKRSAAKAIEIEQRRAQALELRKAGVSLRLIAERLGVSHVTVLTDIEAALAVTRSENAQVAEELRALEVEVLDSMYMAIAGQIRQGSLPAIDRGLRIRERRAKLLGLDMPTQVEVTDWRSQALADIRAGRLSYEQVLNAFGDPDLAQQLFREAGVPVTSEAGA